MIFSHPQVICASSRKPGNMSLSYGPTQNSLEHRQEFLSSLGIDYRDLVCAQQVHSSQIQEVTLKERGRGAISYEDGLTQTDALITREKNLPLAIFTADCLAVFLYDPVHQAIGLVHTGWRSSREEICIKALSLMQEKYSTQPQEVLAGFSPAIRSCCYEVGEEFCDYFPALVEKRGSAYYLDLISANKKQLVSVGVKQANISDSNICTSCKNDEFFSYRREGKDCGRMMSVAMLKPGDVPQGTRLAGTRLSPETVQAQISKQCK